MSWRLAHSLVQLRKQVDEAYPNRSKSCDGSIGDTAHSQRASDHNPNSAGVVCAIDLTHDPSGGFDSYKFAEMLRNARDPRVQYVISNGRIWNKDVCPYQWRPYKGSNAHNQHVHISVVQKPAMYDDAKPWELTAMPKDTPNIPDPQWPFSGRGSWYSQNPPVWIDEEDEPNSNALGVPDDKQGIALYDRSTLGKWFRVTAPNNVTLVLQQTDIGPHPNTGRKIDIAAVAAERFGYSPSNFPTDEIFTWTPIEAPMADDPDVKTVLAKVTELLEKEAEAVAKLDARIKKLEQSPSYLGAAVQNSPFLAILGALVQVFATQADVIAAPLASPTGTNTAASLLAVFVAGVVNWLKPKEPAK